MVTKQGVEAQLEAVRLLWGNLSLNPLDLILGANLSQPRVCVWESLKGKVQKKKRKKTNKC